jgi:homoserine/homoserine lactone efflux protein
MALLLSLMIVIEFSALLIYAWGGRGLSELLLRRGQAQWLNRVAALLMVMVAGWLVLG